MTSQIMLIYHALFANTTTIITSSSAKQSVSYLCLQNTILLFSVNDNTAQLLLQLKDLQSNSFIYCNKDTQDSHILWSRIICR